MATALLVDQLEIGRGASVAGIEAELRSKLMESRRFSPEAVLRVVQDPGSNFFADIWTAVAVGTAARAAPYLELALWGVGFASTQASPFWASPGGFAAMEMAHRAYGDSDRRSIDLGELRRRIAQEWKGVGDVARERSRTIVEFDHDYPLAKIIAPTLGTPSTMRTIRRRLIDRAVLEFKQKLDLGALRRKMIPQAEGAAGAVGAFIFELYDNADQYGRPQLLDRGVRMLRMRKHVANNREELLARAAGIPGLEQYILSVCNGIGTVALIEASVSDFGAGILDGFLATPAGQPFRRTDRRSLVDRLLHERFGSRPADPASGRGISNALEALSSMGGYASMRSAEFFAWASCASSLPKPRMSIEQRPVPIVGTHWQMLWPMAL